jgi:hypothetical protein
MTLRRRLILLVTPAVLLIVALSEAVLFLVQYRELWWGYTQQSEGIAVAAAAHIESARWRDAARRFPSNQAARVTLDRVLELPDVRWIGAFDHTGKAVWVYPPEGGPTQLSAEGFEAVTASLQGLNYPVATWDDQDSKIPTMQSAAQVRDSDDQPPLTIVAAVDLTPLSFALQQSLHEAVIRILFPIGAALLVSLILAERFRADARLILREVAGMEKGELQANSANPCTLEAQEIVEVLEAMRPEPV